MVMPREPQRQLHHIQFGCERFSILLAFGDRKRLAITVHPDQTVTVDAPNGHSAEDVLRRVAKRGSWILKQRDYFKRFQPLPTPRRYVSGETHFYLGRQYRLKIIASDDAGVKLTRGFFFVFTKEPADSRKIKLLLNSWYSAHSKALIERRLLDCFESVKRFGVPFPARIAFRRMKTRWGSCGESGVIVLNTELVKAPVHCVDYVITHELCHLKHANHDRKFFDLLKKCMPDWEGRKERLERVLI